MSLPRSVAEVLIDVRKGVAIEQSVVLATGDRITAVGRVRELAIPLGAKVVNAQGKWLIPGLMDMHVHVSLTPEYAMLLTLYLANAVTTVRDTSADHPDAGLVQVE